MYTIVIDPVLPGIQTQSHPDLLWFGHAASKRNAVDQAYANDLPGMRHSMAY